MTRLERMPEVGDEITEHSHILRVLSYEDRRVGRVSIERILDNEAETDT